MGEREREGRVCVRACLLALVMPKRQCVCVCARLGHPIEVVANGEGQQGAQAQQQHQLEACIYNISYEREREHR